MRSDLAANRDWFLQSNIYDANFGAYRIYYSNGQKGPIYPEITAYAVSLACILYKESGDDRFLERAENCAEQLIRLSEDGLPGHSDNVKYLFDTGIFISALFDLYDITKSQRYINQAQQRLQWLCTHFDGRKFPSVATCSDGGGWDKIPSVHLAKLAIPLLKGFTKLKDEKYKGMAESLLSWAAELQTDEGRFRINHKNYNTRIHPHCYAVEGFLFASEHFNEKLYRSVSKKASDWLAKAQNEDGSFYQWFPNRPAKTLKGKVIRRLCRNKCTDSASQAIRIWKILSEHEENIERAERFLENMEVDSGLPLTRRDFRLIEFSDNRVYSWPTFFYIQSKLIKAGNKSKALELF